MNYKLFEILVCFLYLLPILSYKISLITYRMTLVYTIQVSSGIARRGTGGTFPPPPNPVNLQSMGNSTRLSQQ